MHEFDTIIRGGTLFDGSGSDGIIAEVAIRSGRIAAVGGLATATAKVELDATGLVVCPGFIDAHSHSDAYLLVEPTAPSKVFQGVTTEVIGNCGASAAPHYGDHRFPGDWASQSYAAEWRSMGEYRALLEGGGIGVNVAMLAGHSNIRSSVMGYAERVASDDELDSMTYLLEESLDAGAIGFSTGLLYTPGRWADKREVESLCRVTARRGGIYTSHMRSESVALLESIDEVIGLGRSTGVRCQISHIKASGRANWHKAEDAVAAVESARREGVVVSADRYPYTAAGTELDVIFPDWAASGGRDIILKRLDSPRESACIADALNRERSGDYWSTVMIGATFSEENRSFRGVTVEDAASALGMNCGEAVVEILRRDRLMTGAFFFGMDEKNMFRFLSSPWVMIGSDASIRSTAGPLSNDYPHPRAYGTFARALRMSLDGANVSLTEMIRKMTSLPADTFGIKGRGRIGVGRYADICLFDPVEIRDIASYRDPHRFSEGVRHLFVNGIRVISDGALTGTRPGEVI